MLLRSKSDSSHQIAIYPVSSTTAHGTLRAGPQEHQVGLGTLQLRGNLVTISSKVGKLLVIAVSSKAGSEPEPWRLVERCVEIGRQWLHQLQGRTYQPANHADTEGSPLNRLSFCTWTSLGESESISLTRWYLFADSRYQRLAQRYRTSLRSANQFDRLACLFNRFLSMLDGSLSILSRIPATSEGILYDAS